MTFTSSYVNTEYLISSLREGKEEAFAYIFRLYYPSLLNYAGRILHNREQANDVVQDTFCRLFENRNNLLIRFSLKSYLFKSVYNSCMDLIRHEKVVSGYINQELLDFYFSHIVQSPEVEVMMRDKHAGQAIREAVDRLPTRCREVFRLSKLEGLSNKQIAEQLSISVKTVETQMTTALARLRKDLEWLLIAIFIINS